MVLGNGLIDANGQRHEMLGLLPLETSFQHRKLHLGYRQLTPLSDHFNHPLMAHEFHYARTLKAAGPALFAAKDADHTDLGEMGLHVGHTCGSFAHIISGH
jgi:cobyrinic acid a,c-diamide synthase